MHLNDNRQMQGFFFCNLGRQGSTLTVDQDSETTKLLCQTRRLMLVDHATDSLNLRENMTPNFLSHYFLN